MKKSIDYMINNHPVITGLIIVTVVWSILIGGLFILYGILFNR